MTGHTSSISTLFGGMVLVLSLAGCLSADLDAEGPDWSIRCCVPHYEAILLPYTDTIVVEIDHVEGWAPSEFAMDALKEELSRVTGKSVEIPEPTPIASLGEEYTKNEMIALHLETFDRRQPQLPNFYDGKTVIHVLYLDGEWDERGMLTYGVYLYMLEGVAVVFKENIDMLQTPSDESLRPSPLLKQERRVLIHEVGHGMGLVDRGVPAIEPRAVDGHSDRPESVMGRWVHTEDVLRALQNESYIAPPWRFDEFDVQDIRAFQDSFS